MYICVRDTASSYGQPWTDFPLNRGMFRGRSGGQFSLGLSVGLDVGVMPCWTGTKETRIREFFPT